MEEGRREERKKGGKAELMTKGRGEEQAKETP